MNFPFFSVRSLYLVLVEINAVFYAAEETSVTRVPG